MGTSNYSDEFKRDAVHQITVRGYPVQEVSRRLGVSKYSLHKWLKLFGELEQTILRYVRLYNGQLPQSVLKGRTPIDALKEWHRRTPGLFKKRPYNHTGCDSYSVKYDKAVAKLVKDCDVLLAFFGFPAEHWKQIRTSNPIESTFATGPPDPRAA